jgi:uncharacterized protein (DUF58 family)
MREIKINLLPLIHKLEAFLRKGLTQDILAGRYKSVYKGKGLEFVGFREYTPTDDALLIDWKASLKSKTKMVKVLEEERDIVVFFLIDVSDSMLTSSHDKLKCEYAAEVAGTLCYAITQVGDKAGLGMFSDKMVEMVLPSSNKQQFYRVTKSLSNPTLYGGKFELKKPLQDLMSYGFLRMDSILFVISDFIGMPEGWQETLRLAGLKYDLTCVVVRDPIDMRLPGVAAEVRFTDPYDKRKSMVVSPKAELKSYEDEAKAQIERLSTELKKTDSGMIYLETDKEFTDEIMAFFRRRQKGRA